MPRDFVRQALASRDLDHADDSSEENDVFTALVAELSEQFDLSRQAMAVRLSALLV